MGQTVMIGAIMDKPTIVCLCGSTRFTDTYIEANRLETLAGKIVLSIGCNLRDSMWAAYSEADIVEIKKQLDILHLRKIDLSDEILVLDVDGYIGSSTLAEIRYAEKLGKKVRYWSKER